MKTKMKMKATIMIVLFFGSMNFFFARKALKNDNLSPERNALENFFFSPSIHHTDNHHNSKRKALMCAIVKDEEAYIDEWVNYHYALGFDKIRIYDNSDLNEMKIFGDKKGDHVDVIHYPGVPVANCGLQERAYHDCAQKAVEEGVYTWAAFFDIDEFLVLKKHEDVHDMLEEHLQRGSLGINWYLFGPTDDDIMYSPLPVTKRFMYRGNLTDIIKSIVKLSDFNFQKSDGCYVHKFPLKEGGLTHGFNGESFRGMWNRKGTADVAVLHHYSRKSYKEFLAKRLRGRAGKDPNSRRVREGILDAQNAYKGVLSRYHHNNTEIGKGLIFDDSAWQILKKNVPGYAVFDT